MRVRLARDYRGEKDNGINVIGREGGGETVRAER